MSASLWTLFRWQMLRRWVQSPLLTLLQVLGVALGVAVFLAIQIANRSANRSFAAGVELIAGKADMEVRGKLPETLWAEVAREAGVRAATAVVEGVVTLPDYPGEYLRVVGVDVFSNAPFRVMELRGEGGALDVERWLQTPGGVALDAEMAQRLGVRPGDSIAVLGPEGRGTLRVLAVVDASDAPVAAQRHLAVMDIGWAQELFATAGWLTSIQLLVADGGGSAQLAARLQELAPPDATVGAPRQRSAQMQKMLGAFQLNLSALSMVSLLVGVFLIYGTVSASVTRRRVEIGVLRAMGAGGALVRGLFLGEALCLGTVGLVLGSAAGVLLARGLVSGVGRTISSLYVLLSIDRVEVDGVSLVLAVLAGFAAVLAGAWIPAAEAVRVDPVGALSLAAYAGEQEARARKWPWEAAVGALLAVGCSWVALRSGPAWLGFGAAFGVLVGFARLAPVVTLAVGGVARVLAAGRLAPSLAAQNLVRKIHRNAITAGSLGVAVAMMSALTVMIFSFRLGVNNWVERGIVADLFIAPASNEVVGMGAHVQREAIEWLRLQEEVRGVDTFSESVLRFEGGRAVLAVVGGTYRNNMQFLSGDAESVMQRVFAGDAVAVSESFARHFHKRVGDRLELPSSSGALQVEVGGVYSDYTRDSGVVLMGRGLFEKNWGETGVQSIAVYLLPGTDGAGLAERFTGAFSRGGELAVYSNRALRARIFAVFDQTFAVTAVLRVVAVGVALVGVYLAVSTLVAERVREIAMLRALGASPSQVQGFFVWEAAMVGASASLLGLCAGLVLAVVLTGVVNPAFFGWSIPLRIPWVAMSATPVWIVCAAALAAWQPARLACQGSVAQALKEG